MRDSTAAATALGAPATPLVLVRWKPSTRSQSLSDISALSAPPARIGIAEATLLRRERASPFQSARNVICGVGYRSFNVETACATYFSWWTDSD